MNVFAGKNPGFDAKQFVYMLYRKMRAPFGIPFGFTLMYAAYGGGLTQELLFAGLGLFWIEVFAGMYNDYWDIDEDLRNGRRDKFTTSGVFNRKQMWFLSYVSGLLGLLILSKTNFPVFLTGLYYFLLFIGYSHPRIRLKGWVGGYAILSSMYLFFPFALNTMTHRSSQLDVIFAGFCFSQFMYILCQKDSTDPKDDSNLFIVRGWKASTHLTFAFALSSSLLLLALSLALTSLLLVWGFNLLVKTANIYAIHSRKITRGLRSKLVLMEFLTPLMFYGVAYGF